MQDVLTIRLDRAQRRALADAARRRGVTTSEIVRDALERVLAVESVATRAGHVRGSVTLPRTRRRDWRKSLRERNWRV